MVDELPERRARGAHLVSALTGAGIDELVDTIAVRQHEGGVVMRLEVPHEDGRAAAQLHEVAEIVRQTVTPDATIFTAWIPNDAVHLFAAYSADHLLETAKVS
jgi:50S ribosomal subunit-associated GTPase HflX